MFELPFGATPLTPEETDELIPAHISTKEELNEFEQKNILEARIWLHALPHLPNVLDGQFLKKLHRRMFNQTWKWAGHYRKTEKNIGIAHLHISREVEKLVRDIEFWIKEKSFSEDEIAVRFHHQLVSIHCYPNGNGRHARLAADLLVQKLGGASFTWGRDHLITAGKSRTRYIEALRQADQNKDYQLLSEFARS